MLKDHLTGKKASDQRLHFDYRNKGALIDFDIVLSLFIIVFARLCIFVIVIIVVPGGLDVIASVIVVKIVMLFFVRSNHHLLLVFFAPILLIIVFRMKVLHKATVVPFYVVEVAALVMCRYICHLVLKL